MQFRRYLQKLDAISVYANIIFNIVTDTEKPTLISSVKEHRFWTSGPTLKVVVFDIDKTFDIVLDINYY